MSLRSRPGKLGLSQGRLELCPPSPNCVCSDHVDTAHGIEPLRLAAHPEDAWPAIERSVRELPRTRIVNSKPGYLHAECASAVFGFVDDLELNLRPDEGIIAVRSASRLGYSDFGVNRRRVEQLRKILHARNILL